MTSCSERLTPSGLNPDASELLAKANAAKTQPLSADASRGLESRLVDEIVKYGPKEEAAQFRKMLNAGGPGTWELDPNAPDTPEVKRAWALMEALLELRQARFAAEHLAKNPPFDSTGSTRVQIVFLSELIDTTAAAMIYRRPDDNGRPLLVVREDSLNARDLYTWVRMAARSVQRSPATVSAEQWISVQRDAIAKEPAIEPPEGYQMMIEEKQSFVISTFPGVGKGRTIGAWVRIPTTRR
ncbi:MAG: hypothetical protein H7Z40_21175 [Phycisphaerae bacterium]|nr:hypothetical protein [Gemmatimonadaceae bacterium]